MNIQESKPEDIIPMLPVFHRTTHQY